MEDNKKHICKFCNKEFNSGQSLGAHIIHCNMNPNSYQSEFQIRKKKHLEENNPLEEHKLICEICGSEYKILIRHNQFKQGKYKHTCSRSCASKLTALHSDLNCKNKKISQSNKGNIPINRNENFSYYKECKQCGLIFDIRLRNSKSNFCCDDCKNKYMHYILSEHAKKIKFGGYHPNSIKKHHHGNYKGIHCDSSWELAYLVYCLEHNIKIKRCDEVRYYKLNKKVCRYFPDFIINDNEIIEIKGYYDKVAQYKSKQNPDIKILFKEDLNEVFEYVINKYGNKFWEVLYENNAVVV